MKLIELWNRLTRSIISILTFKFWLIVALVVFSVFTVLVLSYVESRQVSQMTLKGEITEEEFEQLVQYCESWARRQIRIKLDLPVEDPNCDPNNYPLSPRLARAPFAAKKYLCMIALLSGKVKRERLDDPNGQLITFFMHSDPCFPDHQIK